MPEISPREALLQAHISYLCSKSTMPLVEITAIAKRKKRKLNTANGVQTSIIDYCTYLGYMANRINVIGRKIKTKTGKEVWIKSATKRGTADISIIAKGIPIEVEVKFGKDRQSDRQKTYAAKVRQAGGFYLIAETFDSFYNQFHEIITNNNNRA